MIIIMKNFYLYKICLLAICFNLLLCIAPSIAQSTITDAQQQLLNNNAESLSFEENKGQVQGEDKDKVRFTIKGNGLDVFILENGIAYQYKTVHYPEGYEQLTNDGSFPKNQEQQYNLQEEMMAKIRTETFRMDAILIGANKNSQIITEQKSTDYIQYYNHNALNVHSYQKIIYKDIYPKIDWVLFFKNGALEYEFVVHPGGNPNEIKIRYDFAENIALQKDGSIKMTSQMGDIADKAPISFQGEKTIATNYILNKNVMQFQLADYDPSQTLIIDPVVEWATYYGGVNMDYGYSCAVDALGNVYMAGATASSLSIASGGHQNTYGGNADAFIVKFNASGIRQWASYYGGGESDYGHSCAIDASGNVYMVGYTFSPSSIASSGHQNTYEGNADAFIVKFNASGIRQWASYYGGTSGDVAYHCAIDAVGNVYMSGYTLSSNSIATAGSHQAVSAGNVDAFLVKFNSLGVRQWGTYYGGSGTETAFHCTTDAVGNVYLSGYTNSTTSIASGGHQNTYGGGNDAFLVKFNSSGARQWATYYGGTAEDVGFCCAVDANGNVYLMGYTVSAAGISTIGSHQATYGGGNSDAYLVKFNAAGARQWSTYYGGIGNETQFLGRFGSLAIDADNNVLISGFTTSTNAIATSGSIQPAFSGGANPDAFLAKFNTLGVRLWGTYYGGTGEEVCNQVAVDANNNIYITGHTSSASNIANNGHQNVYGGGSIDAFLVKIKECTTINIVPTAGIVYVDSSVAVSGDGSSWANATKELADALKAASTDPSIQQIWVAKGTYLPLYDAQNNCASSNSRQRTFLLVNDVEIYGGFNGTESNINQRNIQNNPAVLSGDIGIANNNSDNVYHVMIGVNINNVVLDGLIIEKGNASGPASANITIGGVSIAANRGGGINLSGAGIEIVNSIIRNNQSINNGGGIFASNNSSILINHTAFNNNASTASANNQGGGAIAYIQNSATSALNINNSIFNYNSSMADGGAILNHLATLVNIGNSFFHNNFTSDDGGAVYNNRVDNCHITNSVFYTNTSMDAGGGIYNTDLVTATISNSTFYNNTSATNGGAIGNQGSVGFNIRNNIIYGNSSSIGYSGAGATFANVANNIVAGGYAGATNLDLNPLFVNPANPPGADGILGTADDGLSLRRCSAPLSPAINSGNNTFIASGITTDITGAPRIVNSTVDRGAYEIQAMLPPLTGTATVSICQGQSYTFNGIVYTANNNTATDTLPSASGCDSIVTLNLTVTPNITNTINPVICQGGTYTFGGTSYTTTQSGVQHTFQTAAGCDSIVTMNLTVTPNITNTINPVICQGGTYTFGGTVYNATQSGAQHTFQTAAGCDSVVTMNLTVNPALTGTATVSICQGQSYTFNGNVYTTSNNTATDTLPSTNGCDSIVTLNLTVNPVLTGTEIVSICQGQSYTFNGIVYTTSNNTATDTLLSVSGCDSIVTLNLTVNPTLTGIEAISICQGQSYTFNGNVYTVNNNTATDTLLSANGCDSIVTLNLTVNPVLRDTLNVEICFGASYSFAGNTYSSSVSGVTENFPNAAGCDSMVTLNLTVNELEPQPELVVYHGCDEFIYNNQTYTQSTSLFDTFYSTLGCDSIYRETRIIIHHTNAAQLHIDTAGCDEVWINGNRYTASTTVKDTLYTIYGCDSLYRDFNVTVNQFQMEYVMSPEEPYEMERFSIQVSNSDEGNFEVLRWLPTDLFPSQNVKQQYLSLIQNQDITVWARSSDGCYDTLTIPVTLKPYSKEVGVPNAFTPNGDGLNDVFVPKLLIERGYSTYQFNVYNRYGQIMYSTANMNSGWDGTFKGKHADQGVYYYKISILFLDQSVKKFEGEVTLIR